MNESEKKTVDLAWVKEQIVAFVMGGLNFNERAEIASHVAACESCGLYLKEIEDMDRSFSAVGMGVPPGSGFEARVIQALPRLRRPNFRIGLKPWQRHVAAAVAASVALAAAGIAFTRFEEGGRSWMMMAAPWRAAAGANEAGLTSVTQNDVSTLERSDELLGVLYKNKVKAALAIKPAAVPYDIVMDPARGDYKYGAGGPPPGDMPVKPVRETERQGASDRSGSWAQQASPVRTESAGSLGGQARFDAKFPKPSAGGGGGGIFANAAPSLPPEKKFLQTTVSVPSGGTLMIGGQILLGDKAGQEVEPGAKLDDQRVASNSASHQAGNHEAAQKSQMADSIAPDRAQVLPAAAPAPSSPQTAANADVIAARKIIRNGQMEFEVDSFDSAFLQISKIAAEEQGVVTANDSEKLANGKVRGTISVRVPPEHLDVLILKLRGLGDLKSQHIASQDITKEYTDIESQLRAANAMQERLLEIIKNGKGEVKDLVAAEKELGEWREKCEKYEGEIRYYNNLVSLSTLVITVTERDMRAAASATQQEVAEVGVETEEVEKSYRSAIAAIGELKGQVTDSQLSQLDAGQFAARVVCEISAESSGPLIDHLRQLGRVARLEMQRSQTATDGSNVLPAAALKVELKPTRFAISFYNLTTIAPRQTTTANFACADVENAYKAILDRVAKAGGRMVSSNLNHQKAEQTSATLNFEIKTADADAVLADVKIGVDVMSLNTTENPDTAGVTTAKRGFALSLIPLAAVGSRQTQTESLACANVSDAYSALVTLVHAKGAHIITSQLSAQDARNVSATLDVELPRADEPEFEKAITAAGQVMARNATQATDDQNTVDTKVRTQLSLISAESIAARQVTSLQAEVADVDKAVGDALTEAIAAGGKIAGQSVTKDAAGHSEGKLVVELSQEAAAPLLSKIKDLGTVRGIQASTNSDVPDGKLARARIELSVSNSPGIVSSDSGVWSTVRNGLSVSVAGLLWSLNLIIVGLFVVGPWVAIAWLVWKIIRRRRNAAVA